MSVRGTRRWYVVQTYSGYEKRVKANLEQRIATMGMEDSIFSVLIPIEERISVKDGKSRKISRKLYPSYVLVEMCLDEQSWYVVRHTPGITGFVGAGTHPLPLSEKEVREILGKLDKDQEQPKIKIEMNIERGDTVKVKEGPFEGQVGPVVEVNPEKGKVKFTVSVFGRETVIEADFLSLEKL
ncbi:MAG: transcription termination/antitermination protein NusG [Synergistaceae bacterium]|nr:transcription termination/antitermination protein NusG [Synergistaceae bacterium]